MHLSKYVLAIIVCTQSLGCIADDGYQNLKLDEAIQIALQNNLEKKVSRKDITLAESRYKEALSARWPTLDFQAGFQHSDNPMTQETPAFDLPLGSLGTTLQAVLGPTAPTSLAIPEQHMTLAGTNTSSASLNLNYPLFTGGKISSIIEQAEAGKEIAGEDAKKTESKVIYNVKRYYYATQLTQALSKVAEDTYQELKYNAKIAKRMYEAGDEGINKLDYYKLENAVSLADNTRVDFLGKSDEAKAALIFSMGLDLGTEVTVSQALSIDTAEQVNLAPMLERAKQFNPDINKLKLATRALDAKIDEARSDYFPHVGLFANNKYADLDGGSLDTSDNRHNWTVGIGVRMSLFNGGMTSHRVNSAKLQRLKLMEQQSFVESGIALLIKNKYIDLQKAIAQVSLSEKALDISQDNVSLVNRAFSIKSATSRDVIEASYHNALIQSNLIKAQHDVLLNLADIENTLGTQAQFE